MKMAVFRQGQKPEIADHLDVIRQSKAIEEVNLISWSLVSARPVLAGYRDAQAVIKLWQEGDEAQSFEALYDDAVTLRDLRRMMAHEVQLPEDIGPGLFEGRVVFDIAFRPSIRIQVPAATEAEARDKLRGIINQPEIRGEIISRVAVQIFEADDADLTVTCKGMLRVSDVAPKNCPPYIFIENSEADDT